MVDSERDTERRWVARLTATPDSSIDRLLETPRGLDLWERHGDELVVAASDAQLAEIERRQLAHVERIGTVEELEARARGDASTGGAGD
jgi:hypothetical protein